MNADTPFPKENTGYFAAEGFNGEIKHIAYAVRHSSIGNYTKHYETWRRARNIISCFQDELKKKHVETAADIGCADGLYIFVLDSAGGAKGRVRFHGVDINAYKISRAEEIRKRIGLDNVTFSVGEAQDTKLTKERFDVVLLCEVIEHLVDSRKCLDEIRRILKPGGIAIITTPNGDNKMRKLRSLFGPLIDRESQASVGDDTTASSGPTEHVSVRGRLEWERLFREKGFLVEKFCRGSLFSGGAKFDRFPFLFAVSIILDCIFDRLFFTKDLTENLTFLLRKT